MTNSDLTYGSLFLTRLELWKDFSETIPIHTHLTDKMLPQSRVFIIIQWMTEKGGCYYLQIKHHCGEQNWFKDYFTLQQALI